MLLKSIADALTAQVLKVAVDKALTQLRAGQGGKLDRRTAVERELSLIGAKKEHLVDAIAEGNKDPAIRERLNAEETKRQKLILELERLSSAADLSDLNEARLKRDLKGRLADTQALLSRQMSSARRLLKALINQPLRCEAVREGTGRGYRITGTGSYLPLLPEFGCSVESGVPNGI